MAVILIYPSETYCFIYFFMLFSNFKLFMYKIKIDYKKGTLNSLPHEDPHFYPKTFFLVTGYGASKVSIIMNSYEENKEM